MCLLCGWWLQTKNLSPSAEQLAAFRDEVLPFPIHNWVTFPLSFSVRHLVYCAHKSFINNLCKLRRFLSFTHHLLVAPISPGRRRRGHLLYQRTRGSRSCCHRAQSLNYPRIAGNGTLQASRSLAHLLLLLLEQRWSGVEVATCEVDTSGKILFFKYSSKRTHPSACHQTCAASEPCSGYCSLYSRWWPPDPMPPS